MSSKTSDMSRVDDLLRRAPDGPDARAPIDDEDLALLAEGRSDMLAPADRDALLRRVAAQPWAAQLVKELADVKGPAAGEMHQPHSLESIQKSPPARKNAGNWRMFLWCGWALAACLTLSLAGYNWYQGKEIASNNIGNIKVNSQSYESSAPSPKSLYWDDLDRQRLGLIEERQHWRETSLVLTAVLSVGISIVLVYVLAKRDPRQ